jgi:hypothetical protein
MAERERRDHIELTPDGYRTASYSASTLHVIPVPPGWSAEQAWEAIQRGVELRSVGPAWAVVELDQDGRMIGLVRNA